MDIVEAVNSRKKNVVFSMLEQLDTSTLLQTVFLPSCRNGWLDVVEELVIHHCLPVTTDDHGATPLHFACASGNIELVEYLIECGCSVLACTEDRLTVLHCAVMGGLQILKFLVQYYYVAHFFSYNSSTIMLFAYYNWNNELLKFLIIEQNCGITVDTVTGDSLLHYACRDARLDRLQFLIEQCGCNPCVVNNTNHSLLYVVCSSHDQDRKNILLYLMGLYQFDILFEVEQMTHGLSAIFYALMERWEEVVVRLLLKAFPREIYVPESQKYHIVSLAYHYWSDVVIKFLINEMGFGIATNSMRNTVLHNACRDMNLRKLKFLIKECYCDLYVRDKDMNTLLHAFSSSFVYPSSSLLSYLKSNSAPFATNGYNCTPLEWAVVCSSQTRVHHSVAMIRCLVQEYGELDSVSLFDLAFEHGSICNWSNDMVKYVLFEIKHAESVVTDVQNILLQQMCKNGNTDQIEFLLKEYSMHDDECTLGEVAGNLYKNLQQSFDKVRFSLLQCAVINKKLNVVIFLLKKCNLKLDSHEQWSILDLAHTNWDDSTIKYLLTEAEIAESNIKKHGYTLLQKACEVADEYQVRYLMETCHCIVEDYKIISLIHSSRGNFEILQYLCIECSFQPNLNGKEAGILAIKSAIAQNERGIPVLKHLVERCNISGSCEIMMFAYENWCEAVIKYFILEMKFDMIVDESRNTILHISAVHKEYGRLMFLLEVCCCRPCDMHSFIQFLVHHIPLDFKNSKLAYVLDFFFIQNKFQAKLDGLGVQKIVQYCCINESKLGNTIEICSHVIEKCSNLLADNKLNMLLFTAFKYWNTEILRYLILEKKCDLMIDEVTGATVLHGACLEVSVDKLKFLLEECKCDIKSLNFNNQTIFHTLCILSSNLLNQQSFFVEQFIKVVTYLSKVHSIEELIIMQDKNGNTIIHNLVLSIAMKTIEFFDILHLLNYIRNYEIKNNDGRTILHMLCCVHEHDASIVDYIKRLIENNSCDYTAKDLEMNTILHMLASKLIFHEFISDNLYGKHSSDFLSLIQYLLIDRQFDVTSQNKNGDTALHVACHNFNGDVSLITLILSTGKADPLARNESSETPLMLLDSRCCQLNNPLATEHVKKLISDFGRVRIAHPIHSYVKVILLGNPGAGKSTLAKVIEDRTKYPIAGQFRNVRGVELHTAGIIPKVLNNKDVGRIILHDLAGQAEYYASHAAVMENLLQGSAAVFVLVVSLADDIFNKAFHLWLNIIQTVSQNALYQCQLIIAASHIDHLSAANNLEQLKKISSRLKFDNLLVNRGVFGIDCRKLGGSQLSALISAISLSCKSITNTETKTMSLHCHLLYEFFQQHRKESVYTLESLAFDNKSLYLPEGIELTLSIVLNLASTGLISFFKNPVDLKKSWIVVNKSILLSDLNGILFAPEDFKQHVNIASNIGVIKSSDLYSLFPKYDSKLLLQFLQCMELCSIISGEFIDGLIHSNSQMMNSEQYIFVPALIRETKQPQISEIPNVFGWCLHCSGTHFFLARFLHLVQLRLACKFSIHNSDSPNMFERYCNIWTKGLCWNDTKGIQTFVKLVDSNQAMVVFTSCETGAESEMFHLIEGVLYEILLCKQQSMPQLATHEFIIDSSHLERSMKSLNGVSLYSVGLLAQCYINNDRFILDTTGEKRVAISKLVSVDVVSEEIFKAVFAGRHPKHLADSNYKVNAIGLQHCESSFSLNANCGNMFTDQESLHNEKNVEEPKQNLHKEYVDAVTIDTGVSSSSLATADVENEVPSLFVLFNLLRNKSAEWDSIGRDLGIPLNDRESLRRNVGLDDKNRLEKILQLWLELTSHSSSLSWDLFISAMKRLEYNDVIESIKEKLATRATDTDNAGKVDADLDTTCICSPIEVNIGGDGAIFSKGVNYVLLVFSLPSVQKNLSSQGLHTIASYKGFESYGELKKLLLL